LQKTLKSDAVFIGTGLHTGADVKLCVRPAAAETGIWFRRTDVAEASAFICANWQFSVQAALCTRLENEEGVSVSTVEHIMAALAGCGINNAILELNGPELPIMDGSAQDFVRGFLKVGFAKQTVPVRALEILEKVEVSVNGAYAALEPYPGTKMEFMIDFPDAAIGQQFKSLDLANGSFVKELSNSRTFCANSDVDVMRSRGLALGGTLMNALVVDGSDVLNPGGMRYVDEPVRHKMLDAVGDLALAGGPIIGRYIGRRSGHTATNKLLKKLFSKPLAFRMIDCNLEMTMCLPGAGVVWDDVCIAK
jgi:UDP-3-O-[3-hydroxymyristoyl] N-acetylglucosamine deacetylase